jgi:membrane protein YdbS with pleckstrin-like domain
MAEAVNQWLLRVLRVPAEPAPPPGDPASLRVFRAAPSYFRYSVVTWVLKQISAASALAFSYFFYRNFVLPRGVVGHMLLLEQLAIAGFLLQLPFTFALLRLDFRMRWYMLSDRALRIRSGILRVREQTMTFANVQNISVLQNPLQRLFGIHTVAVRAAGGGGAKPSGEGGESHEARFEGVADGAEIRNAIRHRVRQFRDAGLGDPDDAASPAGGPAAGPPAVAGRGAPPALPGAAMAPMLQAARRLQQEAVLLRRGSGDLAAGK